MRLTHKSGVFHSVILSLMMGYILYPTKAVGGCSDQTTQPALHDRSWIQTDKIIYFGDDNEDTKIYRRPLNGNKADLLVDTGYKYTWSFELSPDGNYFTYSGLSDKDGDTRHYYDVKHGIDYKLPITMQHVEFSPDSKKLLWANDLVSGKELKSKGDRSFTIMNLVDRSSQTVPYPFDLSTLGDYRGTDVMWAPDGDNIYIGTISYPVGVYFKFDVLKRKFSKLEGSFTQIKDAKTYADYGIHFRENGKDLPYYKPTNMQWLHAGIPMKGETATIDKDYNLIVKTPDGKEVKVDKGEYSNCEGVTIRVLSWLEEGKYLVYEVKGIPYVYGIKEKKKAFLFDSGRKEFFWVDDGPRKESHSK